MNYLGTSRSSLCHEMTPFAISFILLIVGVGKGNLTIPFLITCHNYLVIIEDQAKYVCEYIIDNGQGSAHM